MVADVSRAVDDVTVVTVESAPPDWTAYVLGRSAATGYHDWRWREVFKRAFGYDSLYFAARRRGRIVGVLPTVLLDGWLFGRALISLPFVNYGGVVADDAATERVLLDCAMAAARKHQCGHVEMRHFRQHFPELACKRHKVTMTLPLRPAPEMWAGLDRKARNQVRKAQKSGLTYEVGGGDLLESFYAVFARNMRDLGTPVYGAKFFEEILGSFPDRTRIHLVRHGTTPIAAGLTFQTGTTIEIPWASSVRDFNGLCPNHLLYWSALESAVGRGCSTFDFGRSTPNEGTYKFKEQWGAQPVPLYWEYGLLSGGQVPNSSPTNPKFCLAISLWKKLPVSVATRIGPMIVRSIP
jgi:FemAB-related protein (PEP-CTERM system-associated)